ncbi:MAG: cell division protein SepF [Ruminococcaceae bacterium]|nr:cell division protein SepF [Oscillospiraceae bacterium]
MSETDDDEFDDFYDDAESFGTSTRTSRRDRERELAPPATYDREEKVAERPLRRQKSDKVVNIHTTAQLQVVLCKPERYEEAAAIADHLNERRTVVLNLESTNRDVARRLLDFLSGVAYANNGQIKRVANSTYIITPYNVDVMGDLIDELENNGMFM